MSTHDQRLAAVRAQLKADRLDGFAVPLSDEHLSEYVGSYAQRLAWLTGFQGSAGAAVVLSDKAAIFTDGRYTLQVRTQVNGDSWEFVGVPKTSIADWLKIHAPEGARIGYDPWVHSKAWTESAAKALAEKGAALVSVERNPLDAVWDDQPAPSPAKLLVHPDVYTGKTSAAKRQDVAAWLAEKKLDAVVLTALDSIAWLLNIRGSDVERTPVALCFAIVHKDGTADLYVDPIKLDADVRAHLGPDVHVHPRADFSAALHTFKEKRIAVDPDRAVAAIFHALHAGSAEIVELRDPTLLPKAIKNAVEQAGHRAAQLRDGAALARFFHWLAREGPTGHVTELTAADQLHMYRKDTGLLRDLSFDTISGAGPNGAIVHYRADASTCRRLDPGSMYLVDSGGQYPDGTTDVTRTLWIGPGTPTPEMKDRYTRVLKGHIALARIVFPKGTRGSQLDVLARQFLWAAGVDYAHGTGHGVGSFLSVHEGPQRIATSTTADEALQPGMILSNEPGYYKTGAFGIRLENLILVEPRIIEHGEGEWLGFETLTLAPFDHRLIEVALLTAEERDWLNRYHARVRALIGPQLAADTRAWLHGATGNL